jgi:predicted nuclease of predicted toxin-antitoxin system
VRLLFEQNLSRNLVGQLREEFPDSQHVAAVDLGTATDREVWQYAGEHGYVLVSKDSDFRQLAFLHGPPPKVLWLRVGNVSTATVRQVLLDHRGAIETFVAADEEALLVLPGLADASP